jgi:hypothetical protein
VHIFRRPRSASGRAIFFVLECHKCIFYIAFSGGHISTYFSWGRRGG